MARGIIAIINFATAIIWAVFKMLVALIATSRVLIMLKPLLNGVAQVLGEAAAKLAEAYKRVKEVEGEGRNE